MHDITGVLFPMRLAAMLNVLIIVGLVFALRYPAWSAFDVHLMPCHRHAHKHAHACTQACTERLERASERGREGETHTHAQRETELSLEIDRCHTQAIVRDATTSACGWACK